MTSQVKVRSSPEYGVRDKGLREITGACGGGSVEGGCRLSVRPAQAASGGQRSSCTNVIHI